MNNDLLAAKRSGLRVVIDTAAAAGMDDTHDTGVCSNCGGGQYLYLQTLIAGPFKTPPSNNPEKGSYIGSHNGAWWKMTMRAYPCPVCSNMKEIIL